MKKQNKIHIAIISSDFWKDIVTNLENECLKALAEKGIAKDQVDIIRVPGSLEIPLVAKKLAQKAKYDALIAFGAIHKGKTYHFELIAKECARGCMDVSLQYEIPIIFEVLAVYNIQDAIDRSKKGKFNRGRSAALTAVKMIDIIKELT